MHEFKWLAHELRRLKITNKEAAERLGITRCWFSYCLHGRKRPSEDLVEKVQRVATKLSKQKRQGIKWDS